MKKYTKTHCLLDCKMKFAEKACGCRPWDYPDVQSQNDTQFGMDSKLCDFFGSSCFDNILRQDFASGCERNCVPECNKVSYSIDISERPLDPEDRICGAHTAAYTHMESIIKDYVFSRLQRNAGSNSENTYRTSPELFLMNKLKDILINDNSTTSGNIPLTLDCRRKLKNDIGVVVINIDSPTFSRTTKSQKATTLDKFAYLGNINKGTIKY